MKHAYKSWRGGAHLNRGGSCGTATSFTRATIGLAIRHLLEIVVSGSEDVLKRCAARKAARVFLARAGAQGLKIATRKAAEGTRAHFGAANIVHLALLSTHPGFS